jgi:hypothetical protein
MPFCFSITLSAQPLYIGPPYLNTAQKTLNKQNATTVSSLMTRNSLLIPKMVRPVPAERIAVFEIRLLPGRASIRDWAFFLGSSEGTLDACLCATMDAVGRGRTGSEGRGRAAPAGYTQRSQSPVGSKSSVPIALLARREAMFNCAFDAATMCGQGGRGHLRLWPPSTLGRFRGKSAEQTKTGNPATRPEHLFPGQMLSSLEASQPPCLVW